MTKWRPDGWRIPYNESKNRTFAESVKLRTAYEAGADAMLDAIRDLGWGESGGFTSVELPNDPPEVEIKVSEVMCDNELVIGDDHYRKVNDNHPATEIRERGYFCEVCGEQVEYKECHLCKHKRGISY